MLSKSQSGIAYPSELVEGSAWASFGQWKATASPTPGAINRLTAPKTDEESPETPSNSNLGPCPAGKYRHPETRRCRLLATKTTPSLVACKPGQLRSVETNRCRSVTSTTAGSLTPCQPGTVRNAQTNRCRSVATLAASLKPCAEGQERNKETNRCRKAVASAEPAAFKVQKTPPPPGLPWGWMVAGAAGVGIIAYGAYEWRRELAHWFTKITGKTNGRPLS